MFDTSFGILFAKVHYSFSAFSRTFDSLYSLVYISLDVGPIWGYELRSIEIYTSLLRKIVLSSNSRIKMFVTS